MMFNYIIDYIKGMNSNNKRRLRKEEIYFNSKRDHFIDESIGYHIILIDEFKFSINNSGE